MTDTEPQLLTRLRGEHLERLRALGGSRLAWGIALSVALVAPLFALDAFLILSPALRGALGAGWVVLLVIGFGWSRAAKRRPFSARAVSLDIQERGGLKADEVVAAVDLLGGARPGTSESLRRECVARGERALERVLAEHPVDRRPLRRARLACLTALGVTALLAILFPGVARQVFPRFAQPWADHPPYTRLRFRVEQSPSPVPVRHNAQVRVVIEGPGLPDRAEIVFPREDGENTRARMTGVARENADHVEFTARLSRVEGAKTYYIDTPRGRSSRFDLAVTTRPRLEGAWFRVEPPSYTGWPAREERVTSPNLEALRGSRVTLMLDANLPLGDSRLDWDHPERHGYEGTVPMPALPDPDTRAAGAWTSAVDDHFQAWLSGVNGETSDMPFSGTFRAIPDQPPRVRIVDPDPVVYAPEDWTVDLSISAIDDVRVERLEVTVLRGESVSTRPVELAADRANPTRAQAVHALDLAALGAAPGDRIRYFATAFDNHPDPPQSADSETGTILVVSREAFDDMMREHYQLEDWIAEVSDLLSTLHRLRDEKASAIDQLRDLMDQAAANPDAELSREVQAARDRLDRLREDFDAFAGALSERADLDQLHDWETPYKEWLRETADRMREQQDAASEVARALSPDNLASGSPLDTALDNWAAKAEPFGDLPGDPMDLEQEWDEMVEAMRMVEYVQRLRQLIDAQQDLADRMAAARERSDSPETREILRRLAEAQSGLREELERVQQGLRDSADALEESQPDLSSQGRQIADVIDRLNVPGDQSDAASHAGAARADPAAESAQRAADSLASLAGACEGAGAAGGECLASLLNLTPPGLHPSMEEAMRAALTARPGLSPGRLGRMGAGSGGQMSTVGMVGPQYPIRGESLSLRGARRGGRGEFAGGVGGGAAPDQAREVRPDELPEQFHRAPGLGSIPLRYRRQAAAYFDRLVRDETGQNDLGAE